MSDEDMPRSSGVDDAPLDLWQSGHLTDAALAEYEDTPDAFDPDVRAAFAAHLAECGRCRETLAELAHLRAALSALPDLEPRRSFALTPELLQERDLPQPLDAGPRPIQLQETSAWRRRQLAAVRYAAATAAVLFVLVLGVDLLSNSAGRGADDDSDAGVAAQPMSQSLATEAQADAARNAATPESDDSLQAQPTPAAAGAAAPTATTAAAMAEPPQATTDGESAAPAAAPTETPGELAQAPADDTQADGAAKTAGAEETTSSRSGWRTLEFALALALAWLLAALVILPRLGTPPTPRE